MRGFVEQEQTAAQQDQVTAADFLRHHGKNRFGECHHPGQAEQQGNARNHGEPQSQTARQIAFLRRQAAHQNADENNVVNAQHNFQRGKHKESDPDIWVE